mmetsp:Transcript_17919/g.44735  ORF Transcript_17919/g.44735 Transcript_17919/m.44735 type:complete len:212 (+) Transcript_17919:611-1246(+)
MEEILPRPRCPLHFPARLPPFSASPQVSARPRLSARRSRGSLCSPDTRSGKTTASAESVLFRLLRVWYGCRNGRRVYQIAGAKAADRAVSSGRRRYLVELRALDVRGRETLLRGVASHTQIAGRYRRRQLVLPPRRLVFHSQAADCFCGRNRSKRIRSKLIPLALYFMTSLQFFLLRFREAFPIPRVQQLVVFTLHILLPPLCTKLRPTQS